MKNPYEILGVNKDASQEEIEAAFKKGVKRHHPDNGGDEEAFNQMVLASLVLRDPKKRQKYDTDGVFSQDRPEALYSMAIEQVASFFINSIDAVISSNANMSDFDLVAGGQAFFDQKILDCRKRLIEVNRRITHFEKVMKRLKTKGTTDVITLMLQNHVSNFKQEIENTNNQIEVSKKAKKVLSDYIFEPELYNGLLLPRGFGI